MSDSVHVPTPLQVEDDDADGLAPSRNSAPRGGSQLARLGVLAALVSRLAGRLIGVLFVLVLARTSSDATVAGYGYLLGTSTLILTISDLGVAAISGREVANGRLPGPAALASAIPVQGLTIAAACAVMAVLVLVAKPQGVDTPSLLLTLLFMACNGMVNLWAEVLRGTGRVVAEATLQTIGPFLLVGAGVVVAINGGRTADLLAVVAGKEFLILVASVLLLRPRRVPGLIHMRELISSSFTLSIASTAVVLMWRQGTIYTGARSSAAVVAAYIVATRFQDAGATLSSTIGFGLLPGAAAAKQSAEEEFRALVQGYFRKCLGVGVLAGAIGVTFAHPITVLAFGERWSSAVPAVRLVAAAAPPIMVMYVMWTSLLVNRQERWLLKCAVVAALLSVGATLVGSALGSDLVWAAAGTTIGVYVLALGLYWRYRSLVRYAGRHARGRLPR